MLYAQINNNIIQNIIVLTDTALISVFSQGYQYFVQVDQLNPIPQLGWTYDGTNFAAPVLPISSTIPLNQQYTPQEYGQLIIDQFATLNTQRNLTSAQLFTLAQNLVPYYILLQVGSLQVFLDEIGNIPVDGIMITNSIIIDFQDAVNAYLVGD